MRIKLMWVLAVCTLMCGTAVADPITPYSCTDAGFTTIATCGIASDWVYPGQLTDPVNGSIIPYPGPALGGAEQYAGSYLAGSVMFRSWTDGTNNYFTVSLTNISDLDTTTTGFGLAAVIFDITGDATLTKVSALLDSGTITYPEQCSSGNCNPVPGGDVGTEFAYKYLSSGYANGPNLFDADPNNGSGGPHYGISSSGLDYFGSRTDLFSVPATQQVCNSDTGTLDEPCSPDGSNFLIVSSGDNSATGNTGLIDDPVIKPGSSGAVIFTFKSDILINIGNIHNVLFQYGTGTSELFSWPDCVTTTGEVNARVDSCQPDCVDCGGNEVPEPASLILVGSGFLGLAGFLRRKLT